MSKIDRDFKTKRTLRMGYAQGGKIRSLTPEETFPSNQDKTRPFENHIAELIDSAVESVPGALGKVVPQPQRTPMQLRRPTTDTVPIMATPGEYVLPVATTQALGGPQTLDPLVQATNGQKPGGQPAGYAKGGYVDAALDFGRRVKNVGVGNYAKSVYSTLRGGAPKPDFIPGENVPGGDIPPGRTIPGENTPNYGSGRPKASPKPSRLRGAVRAVPGVGTAIAGGMSAFDTFGTSTEDYETRFGTSNVNPPRSLRPNEPIVQPATTSFRMPTLANPSYLEASAGDSPVANLQKDIGTRLLGAASDIGNAFTGNTVGDALFRDKKLKMAVDKPSVKVETPVPTATYEVDQPKAQPKLRNVTEGIDPNDLAGFRGLFRGVPQAIKNASDNANLRSDRKFQMESDYKTGQVENERLRIQQVGAKAQTDREQTNYGNFTKLLDDNFNTQVSDSKTGALINTPDKATQERFMSFIAAADPRFGKEALMTMNPADMAAIVQQFKPQFDISEKINQKTRDSEYFGANVTDGYDPIKSIRGSAVTDIPSIGFGNYGYSKLWGTDNRVVETEGGRKALYSDVLRDKQGNDSLERAGILEKAAKRLR